jgi:hypothetical protein
MQDIQAAGFAAERIALKSIHVEIKGKGERVAA